MSTSGGPQPSRDALAILAELPEDAEITVTVRLGDWLRAREARAGGPEVLTTKEAAARYGYTPERWRRWAEAGRIDGVWQDGRWGPWRLPRLACEAHLRAHKRRSRTTRSPGTVALPSDTCPPRRSLPRGPRPSRRTQPPHFRTGGRTSEPAPVAETPPPSPAPPPAA